MKADPTLVAAGYRLGQSYIPGDYSKIFEKQYEGLIAANKAKAQAAADFSKSISDNLGEFMEFKKAKEEEDQEILDNFKELNEIGNTYTDHKAGEFAKDMEDGNSLPGFQFDAAETFMEETANEYERLSKITFPNAEQKKQKRALKKAILEFRPAIVKSRANQSTKATLWNTGQINKDLSFKGRPNEQALYSLTIDKHQTTDKLAAKGVKSYWENGEKIYSYPDGLWGAIYGEVSDGGADGVDVIPVNKKGALNTITETNLLAMLSPKDSKTEEDLNGISTKVLNDINKTATNPITNAKVRTIKDFASIEDKVERQYYDATMLSENPTDIYTRNILVGNTSRVYKDDLESNRNIDEAVINQMGIGSDVFTAKELEDGVIDPAELAKHKDAKTQIIEILTNPKTAKQKEIAAGEYAKYRTSMLREVFDGERTRVDEAEKPKVITSPTAKTTDYFASVGDTKSLSLDGTFVNKGELENKRTAIEQRRGFYIGDNNFRPDGKNGWIRETSDGQETKYPSVSSLIKSGLRTNHPGFTSLINMDVDNDGTPDGPVRLDFLNNKYYDLIDKKQP